VDQGEKKLRRKTVKLVKVRWSGDPNDYTWKKGGKHAESLF